MPHAGRIDQVFGPAVERVRPVFALGDRQAVFLLHVVAELPQAADDVLLPHLVEDRLEPHEPPALEVGVHVVHDQRDVVAGLGLLLGHLAQDLGRPVAEPIAGHAEGGADLVADPAADLGLEPRGGLEPLQERAPLEVGEHAVELVGDLVEFGQQVLLLDDRLIDLFLGGSLVGLGRAGLAGQRRHRARCSRGRLARCSCSRVCWPALSSGGCCDDSRSTIAGMADGGFGLSSPGFGRRATIRPTRICPAISRRCWLGAAMATLGAWAASFKQVGDRRHPVARDVLQDLEHLGPFFQAGDAELGVAHRLLDQVFAGNRPGPTAGGRWPARRRPGSRSCAGSRAGRALRPARARSCLLVSYNCISLVAHLERLAMPLAQLLGDPDGVLLGVQDIEHVGRRIDPLAAREIILGEQPDAARAAARCPATWPRTSR